MITIVGLFSDLSSVRPLLEDLTDMGVSDTSIEVLSSHGSLRDSPSGTVSGEGGGIGGALRGAADRVGDALGLGEDEDEERGRFSGGAGIDMASSLEARGIPADDARQYAACVREGETLVAVTVEEDDEDEVREAMEDAGALDLDERLSHLGSSTSSPAMHMAARERTALDEADEAAIPLASEEVSIGKREVERGRVRLRTHVVERPVEETVRLREEHVEIERRPASGDASAGDAFKERSVEITERGEEAVVGKRAVVNEEVVVRKGVHERDETVRDTVRKTEVEIDRDRDPGRDPKRS